MSPFPRRQADELAGELTPAERELTRALWIREPASDRRIRRGDDFAGDAWRNARTGELRYIAPGHRP